MNYQAEYVEFIGCIHMASVSCKIFGINFNESSKITELFDSSLWSFTYERSVFKCPPDLSLLYIPARIQQLGEIGIINFLHLQVKFHRIFKQEHCVLRNYHSKP